MQGGVRKRGEMWYYYFEAGKVDGKRKRIERKGGRTKKEALEALRKALEEFEKAGSVVRDSNMSVADYFDYWYKEYVLVNCKYNTQQSYKIIIDKHIKPALGIYKLKSLGPDVLQEFLNKKYLSGFTKSSVSNFFGVLSGALKMAVYPYKMIRESPVKYVKMPKYQNQSKKKNKEDLKIIRLKDFQRIIERFPEGSTFYIPLQIAFHTGMRAAEVCGLTWDCVDLENSTITVEKILVYQGKSDFAFGTPKTESSNRTILIGKTLAGILKRHRTKQMENKLRYGKHYRKSTFVCTRENGETVTTNTLKYLSRVINYELGINFNFHSLRHTHATMLLEGGAEMKDIQERLGHSELATTMDIYTHVTKKVKQNTVDIYERLINET